MKSKFRPLIAATCAISALALSTTTANAVVATQKADTPLSVTKDTLSKPSQVNVNKTMAAEADKSKKTKDGEVESQGLDWVTLIMKALKWVLELLGIGKA